MPYPQSDTPLRHIRVALCYTTGITDHYVEGVRIIIYCAFLYLIFMLHAGILIQSLYKGLELSA
jgi:hypothetical protein